MAKLVVIGTVVGIGAPLGVAVLKPRLRRVGGSENLADDGSGIRAYLWNLLNGPFDRLFGGFAYDFPDELVFLRRAGSTWRRSDERWTIRWLATLVPLLD